MTKKFEQRPRKGKARVNSRAIMKAFVKRYESPKTWINEGKPKKS